MRLLWMLFSFRGRLNRLPYILVHLVLLIPVYYLLEFRYEKHLMDPRTVLFSLFMMLWITLALQAKRWHDVDKSAWWILVCYVPLVGVIIYFVYTYCIRGTPGENRFGPDPLART